MIEICRPLATKQRDLKMFKMASQVVFRPKNVPRFSFGLLVAPKPKNKGGHNAPPQVTMSFQSPGRIGLKDHSTIKNFGIYFTTLPNGTHDF